ncbi:MAG: EAL domain-containing protein [Wenzhouxiangellaceae bacterium]|nr:EAL domain-containing protein [Wenzhouxiangellaceae bacterium]
MTEPSDPAVRDRRPRHDLILAEQTRRLFASLPVALASTVVLAAVLVAVFWPVRSHEVLLGWLAALALVGFSRFGLWLAYRKTSPPAAFARRWNFRFVLLTALAGLVWGAGAWVFLSAEPAGQRTLLMFVVAILGAGAVVNLGVRWQCTWAFVLPALAPYAFRIWQLDLPLASGIAAMVVLYICALLWLSLLAARATSRHVRTSLQLADQVERARRQRQRYRSLVESTLAVIWEGEPETLRFTYVSPEAESMLGYPARFWLADDTFWVDHMHPDDRKWAPAYCRRTTEQLRQHTFDYRMIAADGRVVWLRDVANVLVEGGRAVKLVGAMIDITELKDAQANREYVSDLQQLIVEASRDFLQEREENLDRILSQTLERIGRRCDADRAYLIRFSSDLETYSNTHEWAAPGIRPEVDQLQDVPSTTIPMLRERLAQRQPVIIPSVAELGGDWAAEKAVFMEQDIRSLLVLPIFTGDRLAGLIGFDAVRAERRWTDDEVAALQVLGDLIGAASTRAEAGRRLRASENLRMYAESLAGMGSWEWEIGSEIFHASDEWRNVTGCGAGTLTREQVLALAPGEERARVENALRNTVDTGRSYSIEHRIVRPDNGEERWVRVVAELSRGGSRAPKLRGFMQDVTERKRAEHKLFQLAHYDSLTGLPNRVLALDRLQQSLKRARRHNCQVAVLFLDLDQFKKVNDSLGHDAGDRLLVDAATRLVGLFREQDTVARIGGDEFLIVLDDFASSSDVIAAAGKILSAFRSPMVVGGREFVLTASIGIALSPHDGNSAPDLMRNADTAMYHAKQAGRDAYQFFTRSMNELVARRLTLEEALRGALDRGELFVEYQPLIRLPERKPVGAEALLRWHHPTLGRVAPEEFIEVAEQCGRIGELGRFVFDQALLAVAGWRETTGEAVSVSINVSPRQFRDARFAERVIDALQTVSLPGEALVIEITEGVLLSGRKEVQHTLKTLRRYGVGIMMDDFGTGYSSLSYLRDYPFTGLKIDRGFVHDLDTSERNRQLVLTAIQLASALGIEAIAEGVETDSELDVLLAHHCRLAQGFLFSRPLRDGAFQQLLTRQPGG